MHLKIQGVEGLYALADGRTDRHTPPQTKVLFNLHQKPFRMVYNT